MQTEQHKPSPTLIPFDFEETPIRVILDENGDLWFVAADVCRVLDISTYRDAVARLDDDERGSVKVDTLGGPQEMAAINESGLYTLIFRSNKPQARPFRKWVTAQVLPALRKTGHYEIDAGLPSQTILENLDEIVRLIRFLKPPETASAVAKATLLRLGIDVPAAPKTSSSYYDSEEYRTQWDDPDDETGWKSKPN